MRVTTFLDAIVLVNECQVKGSAALHRLEDMDERDPVLEMQLTGAHGASLAWDDGPTPLRSALGREPCNSAQMTGEIEYWSYAYYGLWLYHCALKVINVCSKHAVDLTECGGLEHGDSEAEPAGQKACGVVHHFRGHHAKADEEMIGMLDPTESGSSFVSISIGRSTTQCGSGLSSVEMVCERGESAKSAAAGHRGLFLTYEA